MKAAAISDSHGNLELVSLAGRRALEAGAAVVFHLGDDLEDARPLSETSLLSVRGVQGVYHPDYRKAEPANRLLVKLGPLALLLTHSPAPHPHDRPEDGDPAQVARRLGAAAVLYGHTHVPAIDEEGGLLWINPGHLRPEDKKGYPPSLALLEAAEGGLRVRVEELHTGKLICSWPPA